MLRCQNLRRGHQRGLIAVFYRDQHRLDGDDGLAGAHIALQQAAHRRRPAHVRGNLSQRLLLRAGGVKRQYLPQRGAHPVVRRKRYAGLLPRLTPLQLQSQFQKEQLFKDQTLLRRCLAGGEHRHGRAGRREVRLAQCAAAARQPEPCQHCLRQGLRDRLCAARLQIVQQRVHHPAQPARVQPVAAQRLINRGNAAGLQQFAVRVVRVGDGLRQNLNLRLDHLEAAPRARGLDLAVHSDPLPRLVLVLEIRPVEPHAFERLQVLADDQLEDRHAAGAEQRAAAHLADHARHLARPQL